MITAPASRSRRTTSASAAARGLVRVGAPGGHLAGDVDVVLDGDRHAQQRRGSGRRPSGGVGLVGFEQRALGEDDAEGVQRRRRSARCARGRSRRARARRPRRRRSARPAGRCLRMPARRAASLRNLDRRDRVVLGGPVALLAGGVREAADQLLAQQLRARSPRRSPARRRGAGCRCPRAYSARSSLGSARALVLVVDRLELVVVDGVDRRLRAHHRDRARSAARCSSRARRPARPSRRARRRRPCARSPRSSAPSPR